jgi:hypothetical protein
MFAGLINSSGRRDQWIAHLSQRLSVLVDEMATEP